MNAQEELNLGHIWPEIGANFGLDLAQSGQQRLATTFGQSSAKVKFGRTLGSRRNSSTTFGQPRLVSALPLASSRLASSGSPLASVLSSLRRLSSS